MAIAAPVAGAAAFKTTMDGAHGWGGGTVIKYHHIDGWGCAVLKRSERLVLVKPVSPQERAKREVPILHLDHLIVGSKGVTISSDAIAMLCDQGIPITVVDWRGRPVGRFSSPALHGSAAIRRAQIKATESEVGLDLAREFISGKLDNQTANLKYWGKNRKTRDPDAYALLRKTASKIEELTEKVSRCRNRAVLMAVEGEAAKAYWSAIAVVFGKPYHFDNREHRGTRNPLNAALNYGYGILNGEVWNSVVLAGLEPYAGVLHVDRPGRLSFVLDMMEEFRPVVVDRVILGLAAKGWKIGLEENGWLDGRAKRRILDAIAERWDTTEPHSGQRMRLRSILQTQARDAARHCMGRTEYQAFRVRW